MVMVVIIVVVVVVVVVAVMKVRYPHYGINKCKLTEPFTTINQTS